MLLTIPVKLFLSFLIGAAIGLEREIHEKHEVEPKEISSKPLAQISFVGVRTLSLVTALGAITGLLMQDFWLASLLIAVFFILLLIVHYGASCWLTHDIGFTTELATGYAYIIGLLIATEAIPVPVTIAITVVVMLILSIKENLKALIDDVQRRELKALIGYGLIALVVLPFLPNESITISSLPYSEVLKNTLGITNPDFYSFEIINFYKLWFIVALITGVDLAGHVLKRLVGQNKGIMISSLVGGFVSSTATVQSLAVQSKKSSSDSDSLLAGSMLANASSFLSFFVVILSVNASFSFRILPLVVVLFLSLGVSWMYFSVRTKKHSHVVKKVSISKSDGQIFSMKPALVFAVFYTLIKIVTRIGLAVFGESGFLVATSLAGLTGIDAASLSIADIAGTTISFQMALLGFVLVNTANLFAKSAYVFIQGSRPFAVKYAVTTLLVVLTSFLALLII